jgi:Flp pilus assembly protein TadG
VTPPRTATTDGSLSLEFALALPLVALCLLALLEGVGLLRDALLVQDAARLGARVAATTGDDGAVVAAVRDLLGADRDVTVAVTPTPRRTGDTITVSVVLTARFGPARPAVHGRAVTRGEPILAAAPPTPVLAAGP